MSNASKPLTLFAKSLSAVVPNVPPVATTYTFCDVQRVMPTAQNKLLVVTEGNMIYEAAMDDMIPVIHVSNAASYWDWTGLASVGNGGRQ